MSEKQEPFYPEAVGFELPRMTLRDWFAGLAMQGLLASDDAPPPSDAVTMQDIQKFYAGMSYDYADAMLAEREKRS